MNEIFTNIQMQLKEELDEKRYEHTIGVLIIIKIQRIF